MSKKTIQIPISAVSHGGVSMFSAGAGIFLMGLLYDPPVYPMAPIGAVLLIVGFLAWALGLALSSDTQSSK